MYFYKILYYILGSFFFSKWLETLEWLRTFIRRDYYECKHGIERNELKSW